MGTILTQDKIRLTHKGINIYLLKNLLELTAIILCKNVLTAYVISISFPVENCDTWRTRFEKKTISGDMKRKLQK